ncbi:MAG: hypothetical protein M3O91_02265 [Chloroflexota bacterium]|nr:hypothetical protein [Chloroflexota bacterium]
MDPGHLLHRLIEPFNSESRFYWPLVIALGLALLANIGWYLWRTAGPVSPFEITARPWALWLNIITLIWVAVLIITKVPSAAILVSFAIDLGALVYLYGLWLPPREAAWVRERRRQRYIPRPERRKKRRRR